MTTQVSEQPPSAASPPWRGGALATPMELEFLDLLNAVRASPGRYGGLIGADLSSFPPRPPLAADPRLVLAAREQAQALASGHRLGHEAPSGADPGRQMFAAGFPWECWGQSVARGYDTPAASLKALVVDRDDPGLLHRAHLLGAEAFASHSHAGVGMVRGDDRAGIYLVLNTARPLAGHQGGPPPGGRDGYVRRLYEVVFGSAAVVPEAAAVAGGIQVNGASDRDMAEAVLRSGQARNHDLGLWFTAYLGRAPSDRERRYFLEALAAGIPEERVQARLLGSEEFQAGAGRRGRGADQAERWLGAVYRLALARDPSAEEVQDCRRRLAGASPAQLALEVLAGPECRAGLARGVAHAAGLGHNPDAIRAVAEVTEGLPDLTSVRAAVLCHALAPDREALPAAAAVL